MATRNPFPEPDRDKHRCPRHGCTKVVSNSLFACYQDWKVLSEPARKEIWRTAKLPIIAPLRRAAIAACLAEWDKASGTPKR